jgi:hypothetical protein
VRSRQARGNPARIKAAATQRVMADMTTPATSRFRRSFGPMFGVQTRAIFAGA